MKHLLFILLFISPTCFGQSNFSPVANIETKANFFTTDNQSNLYVVNGNELSKYNKSGILLYKYSNKNLGNIDFVDASNMLRLLVFYKGFSQIVFLDNTLTLSSDPIRLDEINFQQTQLVCSSYNNSIWIYDQRNLELVRIDKTLNKTQQTGNLNLLLNTVLQPESIIEYNNKVYLNNPTTGILIFDIYGTYYKTIPIKNTRHFQAIGDWIYYLEGDKIKAYHIKTIELKEFEIPDTNTINFRLENENLILQNASSINIYTAQ